MRYEYRALSRSLLIAPLFAVAVAGCQSERRHEQAERQRPATAQQEGGATQKAPGAEPGKVEPTATVAEVKHAPANFYDKQVRVTGKVDKVFGDRAFELEGTGWAFNDNITVLTRTPVKFVGVTLARRDELIVDGTVRRFVTADIERDLGWDLSPEVEVHLKERPVLVADTIRKVGESGRWTADTTVVKPIIALVEVVTSLDPNLLVGSKVDLERERVQSVMGKGLWIGPNHMSQVFVVPEKPLQDIKAGDIVRVAGTLQKTPTDAAKTWNMPPEFAALAREETLYVADATVTKAPASGT